MDLLEQKKISADQFKRHPWEIARFKILLFLLKKNPSTNIIADVGSGDAFVATKLSKKFPNSVVAAVDINYDEQFINENTKGNLSFASDINQLNDKTSIDNVLLMDVLEHIQKPGEILQTIKGLETVSSSTQFFITVPAFQFLFSQHDIFLKHFRRYNRKQLIQLLKQEGFEIKQSGFFFFSLLLPRIFQKLFKIETLTGMHNWKQGRLLTSLMVAMLWIDFKICWYLSRIGINLPGLSCYCVCQPLPS